MKNRFLVLLLTMGIVHSGFAAPPFLTDDTEPVDYKHFQFYVFSFYNPNSLYTTLNAPAFEVNYGLMPNLEINSTIELTTFLAQNPNTFNVGYGDTTIGLKYKIINESPTHPTISFAPSYLLPTANVNRYLGNGKPILFLPLWVQKSWDTWLTYGGGGYAINTSPFQRNYFYGGWVLQKKINDKWSVGGEIYSQNTNQYSGGTYATFDLGAYYFVNSSLNFLGSIGHSFAGNENLFAYLGVNWAV